MKRFIPFLRQLRENTRESDIAYQKYLSLQHRKLKIHDMLEKFIQNMKRFVATNEVHYYQNVDQYDEYFDSQIDMFREQISNIDYEMDSIRKAAFPVGSPQWKEDRERLSQEVHPVIRRAIEKARQTPSREIFVPHPKTGELVSIGIIGENELDHEFERRRYEEERRFNYKWRENYDNAPEDERKKFEATASHLSDSYWLSSASDFDYMQASDYYDQSTGPNDESWEEGKKEQEEYEKRMAEWWGDDKSTNPHIQSWRDNFEYSAKQREWARELMRRATERRAGKPEPKDLKPLVHPPIPGENDQTQNPVQSSKPTEKPVASTQQNVPMQKPVSAPETSRQEPEQNQAQTRQQQQRSDETPVQTRQQQQRPVSAPQASRQEPEQNQAQTRQQQQRPVSAPQASRQEPEQNQAQEPPEEISSAISDLKPLLFKSNSEREQVAQGRPDQQKMQPRTIQKERIA